MITGDGEATPSLHVDAAQLDAAVSDYQSYVLAQTEELATSTKSFTDAIRAGDLDTAKQLYAAVRVPWEQIEPVAELFPDSDGVIDSRADDFPKAEADPDFTGFHALEYGLFAGGEVDMPALADRLDSDIQTLIGEVKVLQIQPQVMTNGAAALIEEAAQTKITGEEERYSGTDLVTLQANVDGAKQVFDLVSPLLVTVNKQLDDDLAAQFAKVQALLDTYRTSDGFEPYSAVSEADRAKLKTSMAELSELLSQVSGSLGLQVERVRTMSPSPGFSRRRLLAGTAAATAGVVAGGTLLSACSDDASAGADGDATFSPTASTAASRIPFEGERQSGITTPPQRHAIVAAFDSTAADRADLVAMFRAATAETRALMAGEVAGARSKLLPPVDNLIVGVEPPPDDLTITYAVGASLFDDRYGLADRQVRGSSSTCRRSRTTIPSRRRATATSSCRCAPRRPRAATTRCAE